MSKVIFEKSKKGKRAVKFAETDFNREKIKYSCSLTKNF